MSDQIQLFEILEETPENFICVYNLGGLEITTKVSHEAFEDYLRDNEVLSYVRDYADHNGEHQQEEGEISYEAFVFHHESELNKELKKYIANSIGQTIENKEPVLV